MLNIIEFFSERSTHLIADDFSARAKWTVERALTLLARKPKTRASSSSKQSSPLAEAERETERERVREREWTGSAAT